MAKSELELSWKDLEVGCVVSEPGNASQYRTGDWRSVRPVWDTDKCIRCGVCYIFCPDMAIQECITGCITMVEEEE